MNLQKQVKCVNVSILQIVWVTTLLLLVATGCTAAPSEAAPEPDLTNEADTYVRLSREALAEAITLDESEIEVESVVEPETPNTAYIITLTAADQHYEYHGRDGEVLLVSNPLPLAPETAVHSEADLVYELEEAGAQVALDTEPMAAPNILSVSGHTIYVNGERLHLYIYDDAALAQTDAEEIEAAPPVLNETVPAHFYRWDNIIALYVGEDSSTLTQLSAVLGEPFAI